MRTRTWCRCGPRRAPESTDARGADRVGDVPRLCEHYAGCDVAVVRCGASSRTELAALRRPFIDFPIEGHLEQEVVARRPARDGAGRGVADADESGTVRRGVHAGVRASRRWDVMPVEGARRAAQHALRLSKALSRRDNVGLRRAAAAFATPGPTACRTRR